MCPIVLIGIDLVTNSLYRHLPNKHVIHLDFLEKGHRLISLDIQTGIYIHCIFIELHECILIVVAYNQYFFIFQCTVHTTGTFKTFALSMNPQPQIDVPTET